MGTIAGIDVEYETMMAIMNCLMIASGFFAGIAIGMWAERRFFCE